MTVSIETIHKSESCTIAVARFHPLEGGCGNEFDAVCTIIIEGTDCKVIGLLSKSTFRIAHMMSLAKALQYMGVVRAFFRRNVTGQFREIQLSKWRDN